MNAAMPQKPPGRRADFNPLHVGVGFEVPQAPPQVGKAARRDARDRKPQADAEYGCVDWYQYHDEDTAAAGASRQ